MLLSVCAAGCPKVFQVQSCRVKPVCPEGRGKEKRKPLMEKRRTAFARNSGIHGDVEISGGEEGDVWLDGRLLR